MTCPQDPGVVAPLTACTTRVAADWLFGIGSGTNRRFAAAVGMRCYIGQILLTAQVRVRCWRRCKINCGKHLKSRHLRRYLFAITDRNVGYAGESLRPGEFNFWFCNFPFGVNKELVGIHVLLTRSLFACDILRRLLPRVSLAKPTSAPLRF